MDGFGQQYFGPINPPVFVGHITQDEKGKRDGTAYEILLGYNSFIEGIHVVPNQITPPGFNFPGRTRPDLQSQQSFALEIHGRISGSNEIRTLLSVTITGGVQWMPIEPTLASLELDYLAIVGTFEVLTIIIHGVASQKDGSKYTPPYPLYYDNFLLPVSNVHPNKRKSEHISRNRVILDSITSTRPVVYKIEDILKTIIADESRLSESLLNTVSMTHSSSKISIDMAMILVEKAFSLNLEQLQTDFELSHRALYEVSEALENCWKPPTDLNTDLAKNIVEEEAILLLCQLLTCCSNHFSSLLWTISASDKKQVQNLVLFGERLFHFYDVLLRNEITASALAETGNWLWLLSLLRNQPVLPPTLVENLLRCIYTGCGHARLLTEFCTPQPTSGTSGYMDLLYLLSGWQSDYVCYPTAKLILALVSLQEHLQGFTYTVAEYLSIFENLAEAINWRKAVYEKAEPGDCDLSLLVAENMDDETKGDRDSLKIPVQQLQTSLPIFQSCIEKIKQALKFCNSFLLNIHEVRSVADIHAEKRRQELVIIHYLEVSGFLPAYITFLHMTNLVQELSVVIDPSEPHASDMLFLVTHFEKLSLGLFQSITKSCPVVSLIWIKHYSSLKKAFGAESLEKHYALISEVNCFSFDGSHWARLPSHLDALVAVHSLLQQFVDAAQQCPQDITNGAAQITQDTCETLLHSGNKLLDIVCIPSLLHVLAEAMQHSFQHVFTLLLTHFVSVWPKEEGENSSEPTVAAAIPDDEHASKKRKSTSDLKSVSFYHRFIINVIVECLCLQMWNIGVDSMNDFTRTHLQQALQQLVTSLQSSTEQFTVFVSSTMSLRILQSISSFLSQLEMKKEENAERSADILLNAISLDTIVMDVTLPREHMKMKLLSLRRDFDEFLVPYKQQLSDNKSSSSNATPTQRNILSQTEFALYAQRCTSTTNRLADVIQAVTYRSLTGHSLIKTKCSLNILQFLTEEEVNSLDTVSGSYEQVVFVLANALDLAFTLWTIFQQIWTSFSIHQSMENSSSWYGTWKSLMKSLLSVYEVCHCSFVQNANILVASDANKLAHLIEAIITSFWTKSFSAHVSSKSKVSPKLRIILAQEIRDRLQAAQGEQREALLVLVSRVSKTCVSLLPFLMDSSTNALSSDESNSDPNNSFVDIFAKSMMLSSSAKIQHACVAIALNSCLSESSSTTPAVSRQLLSHYFTAFKQLVEQYLAFQQRLQQQAPSSSTGKRDPSSAVAVASLDLSQRDDTKAHAALLDHMLMRALFVLEEMIISKNDDSANHHITTVHHLCALLILCEQGLIPTLFSLLHAPQPAVSLMALQVLMNVREALETTVSMYPKGLKTADVDQADDVSLVTNAVRIVSDSISLGLIELVPSLMKKNQDHLPFLQQGICAIYHHQPQQHLYWAPFWRRLAQVGEGFTLEFIAIKLWNAFEDAFQYLHEITDIRKQIVLLPSSGFAAHLANKSKKATSGHNAENLVSILYHEAQVLQEKYAQKLHLNPFRAEQVQAMMEDAHSRFTAATYTLKAILEMILWAYESQKISLTMVMRASRHNVAEARKVIIRFQRNYTMWSTSLTSEVLERNPRLSTVPPIGMMDFVVTTGQQDTADINSEHELAFATKDVFEARHALISLSLRHLCEITNKISKYINAKEEKCQQQQQMQQRERASETLEQEWSQRLSGTQPLSATVTDALLQSLRHTQQEAVDTAEDCGVSLVSLLQRDLRDMMFHPVLSIAGNAMTVAAAASSSTTGVSSTASSSLLPRIVWYKDVLSVLSSQQEVHNNHNAEAVSVGNHSESLPSWQKKRKILSLAGEWQPHDTVAASKLPKTPSSAQNGHNGNGVNGFAAGYETADTVSGSMGMVPPPPPPPPRMPAPPLGASSASFVPPPPIPPPPLPPTSSGGKGLAMPPPIPPPPMPPSFSFPSAAPSSVGPSPSSSTFPPPPPPPPPLPPNMMGSGGGGGGGGSAGGMMMMVPPPPPPPPLPPKFPLPPPAALNNVPFPPQFPSMSNNNNNNNNNLNNGFQNHQPSFQQQPSFGGRIGGRGSGRGGGRGHNAAAGPSHYGPSS